jgi:hypothetical protein
MLQLYVKAADLCLLVESFQILGILDVAWVVEVRKMLMNF